MRGWGGALFALNALLWTPLATTWANDISPIIRPYFSTRSAGMGGVRITTGLYEENFFNNPARVTANPESKLTFTQLSIETNANTVSSLGNFGSGVNGLLQAEAGQTLHQRLQLVMPAWYLATPHEERFAMGIGLMAGFQSDLLLGNTFQTSGNLIADIGPALTVGYKLLPDRSLSVGATAHALARFSADPSLSLTQLMQQSFSLSSLSHQGAMANLDLGATFRFLKLGEWELNAGIAGQNILGSNFTSLPITVGTTRLGLPNPQPLSVGLGLSAFRPSFGIFGATTFAVELTDLYNNGDGSLYRLLHLGGETHFKLLTLRAGLNQGYWAAGAALDLFYLVLDLSSYGEELSLNVGQVEDRRYAMTLGLHI
jgi:hypothetical protein